MWLSHLQDLEASCSRHLFLLHVFSHLLWELTMLFSAYITLWYCHKFVWLPDILLCSSTLCVHSWFHSPCCCPVGYECLSVMLHSQAFWCRNIASWPSLVVFDHPLLVVQGTMSSWHPTCISLSDISLNYILSSHHKCPHHCLASHPFLEPPKQQHSLCLSPSSAPMSVSTSKWGISTRICYHASILL